MSILGLSALRLGAAVALFDRDGILSAIEEEKLTREHEAEDFPQLALSRTLDQFGIQLSDVESVALSSPCRTYRRSCRCRFSSQSGLSRLNHIPNGSPKITVVGHHLCHAASAFYTSDCHRALVLVLDEGCAEGAGLVAVGEDDDIRPLRTLQFASSIGWVYSRVTELLGFRAHRDEHKVQWLSKEGVPEFLEVFRELFCQESTGMPVFNSQYIAVGPGGNRSFTPALYRKLGLSPFNTPSDFSVRAAIACSAQAMIEEIVVELANRFGDETRTDSLCLAGGIFLNVLLVRALEKRGNFRNVYVQPVAGNPGTSLGAAFLARKQVSGRSGRAPLSTLALGPEYNSEQIKSVLDNCKIVYRYFSTEEQLREETARLLVNDKIVAWYQGRTEFGDRALGNRSILASPFSEYVIDNVNNYIKHRDASHPFALSVPAERASEFFDCGANCRFMASLGYLTKPVLALQRFTFNGNSIRVHTVERQCNPYFWKLLHKFGESSPAPILVNTSFNLFGEPLVSDPRAAVRSVYCSGIDALAIGPFLVVK